MKTHLDQTWQSFFSRQWVIQVWVSSRNRSFIKEVKIQNHGTNFLFTTSIRRMQYCWASSFANSVHSIKNLNIKSNRTNSLYATSFIKALTIYLSTLTCHNLCPRSFVFLAPACFPWFLFHGCVRLWSLFLLQPSLCPVGGNGGWWETLLTSFIRIIVQLLRKNWMERKQHPWD